MLNVSGETLGLKDNHIPSYRCVGGGVSEAVWLQYMADLGPLLEVF